MNPKLIFCTVFLSLGWRISHCQSSYIYNHIAQAGPISNLNYSTPGDYTLGPDNYLYFIEHLTYSVTPVNQHYFIIYKTSIEGDTVWGKKILLPFFFSKMYNTIAIHKSTVVAAIIYEANSGSPCYNQIFKFDLNGNLLWSKTFIDPASNYTDPTIKTKNNFIYLSNSCTSHASIYKLDEFGNLMWSRTFKTSLKTVITDFELNEDGDVIGVGVIDNVNYLTFSLDKNGNFKWFRSYTDPTSSYTKALDIEKINENSYMVCGFRKLNTLPDRRSFIQLQDSLGNITNLKIIDTLESSNTIQKLPFGHYLLDSEYFVYYFLEIDSLLNVVAIYNHNTFPIYFNKNYNYRYYYFDGDHFISSDHLSNSCQSLTSVIPTSTILDFSLFTYSTSYSNLSSPNIWFDSTLALNVEMTKYDYCQNTGIADEANITPNIFPNPFTDHLIITTIEDMKDAYISVFNSSGQLMFQKNNVNGKALSLDLAELRAGMYFIHILAEGKTAILKVVKN